MGAYQLMVSRAVLTIGEESITGTTVSVRDGVARAVSPSGETLTMPVASLEKSRKVATVVGTDGTVWTVARPRCGCGGGR